MNESGEGTWESVDVNPAPADLGYEHDPLTTIHVDEDGERYIFLPGEDEHLTDAEFIITTPEVVCEVANWR